MTLFYCRALRLGIRAALLPALLGVALLAGCADEGEGAPNGRVRAVASLEIFADMVRSVGRERVHVDALLPSGAEPHTYELPPGRVADVARADIVFMNGAGLEESIEDVINNNAGGPVVELIEGVALIEGGEEEHAAEEEEEGHEGGNPHAWLDARNAAQYVERIRDALIQVDAAGTASYEAHAAAYLDALDALDREIEEGIETIPAARRKLVTFHDAYPYFAARYGLEVIAVVVPSPGQDPNARDVARLTERLRSSDVPAVFKEPQFGAGILEQAADDAGVRVLDLLSDAYIDGVDSYIELMRYNLAQLLEGLGGD